MSGWYKQTRGWSARPWFKNANMVQLYAYLKDMAYVADGMYRGHLVRRGSCPTTRGDMVYATGLSHHQVDDCLNRLIDFKEIIIKGYNNCTVVTICDYDTCNQQQSLFDLNSDNQGTTKGQPAGIRQDNEGTTTPYNIKEERRIEDNLRSHNIPSKTERESMEGLVRKIKEQYNKTFGDTLPKWQRLTKDMEMKVETCLARFGRQSVDMVFDQIKHEPFSMGENNTGFIADFRFIFKLINYEKYLERYELRVKKNTAKPQQAETTAAPQVSQKPSTGSWIDAYCEDPSWRAR